MGIVEAVQENKLHGIKLHPTAPNYSKTLIMKAPPEEARSDLKTFVFSRFSDVNF